MTSRRNFFAAAAASVSTLALAQQTPSPVLANATLLKFQSAFGASDVRHKLTQQFASRVNALGMGRLKIEVVPSGTVVPSLELLDAVSSDKLDGGFSAPSNWHTKNSAVSLWASGPGFGMNSNMLGAWHNLGGGKALLAEVYAAMKASVISIPFVPVATQPLGWFKKPIARIEDFKGLRFRTNGLASDVFKLLGANVQTMEGAATIEALKKGELDGAEFNNLSTDRALGFDKVAPNCMLQSYHEACGILEVLISAKVWAGLSEHDRTVIEMAAAASFSEGAWFMSDANAKDYEEMARSGVKFFTTPSTVLQATLNAWDAVIAKKSAADPLFAKVVQSQRAYAKSITGWDYDVGASMRDAHRHYFKRRIV